MNNQIILSSFVFIDGNPNTLPCIPKPTFSILLFISSIHYQMNKEWIVLMSFLTLHSLIYFLLNKVVHEVRRE